MKKLLLITIAFIGLAASIEAQTLVTRSYLFSHDNDSSIKLGIPTPNAWRVIADPDTCGGTAAKIYIDGTDGNGTYLVTLDSITVSNANTTTSKAFTNHAFPRMQLRWNAATSAGTVRVYVNYFK